MPVVLVFNPGSASLKFELIELHEQQRFACNGKKLLSASIEKIGDNATLLVFNGREVDHTEHCCVHSMTEGARFALKWIAEQSRTDPPPAREWAMIAVRVVHGGIQYSAAAHVDQTVRAEIERLEELAPLHNKSSLDILAVVQSDLPNTPAFAAFDTAFHQTIPEVAWRYPIDRETADRHGIRKFGFHGLSHRYMLETHAQRVGQPTSELSLVTLHLESGSSATAIRHGQSIDNTMGFTPLEGLMMGTRSGSIDPAIIAYLMRKQRSSVEDVMQLLNKRSGLLGIAGGTFDTRDLVKRNDDAAKLALRMFAHRVRLAIGGYLAALGDVSAVLFGGGIGEDTPSVRADVCAGLRMFGLDFDDEANQQATVGYARLSRSSSLLHAYVIPVEEGLQIAHECLAALRESGIGSRRL